MEETLRQVKGFLVNPEGGEGFMEETLREVKGFLVTPEGGEGFPRKP
jgi:hypothetical protein